MAWIEHRVNSRSESWRVTWRQDGRPQQQTFPDEAGAKEFAAHVEAHGNRWPRGWIKGVGWQDTGSGAPTFTDYAERTITARGRADARTKADYRRMLTRHVHPVIGNLPVDLVTRFHVADIAHKMMATGSSAKTIANVHGLLSSVLADAVADEIIRRNPAKGALPDLPDVRTEEMCFLSAGEVAHLFSCIPAGTYRDLAWLLAGTGLRWSEATALQVGDVDLMAERPAVSVRRAWKRRDGYFELGEPKTRRSRRTVTISPPLVELLIPYVSSRPASALLFTTQRGRPVRHNNWYMRVWLPAVRRAQRCEAHAASADPCGCPGTLPKTPRTHDLRHSHASWLIAGKVTLPAIQRRLGHESIQTTIDRYGHLAPEHASEIDAALGDALGAADQASASALTVDASIQPSS